MRLRFKWIYTLLLAFLVQFSFAQEKTITGVVSENGMPLPGATVVVKGTSKGVPTDFDGKYSIKAKTGDVLEFSYVGMKTKSATVGASSTLNVSLDADNTLEEVLIRGYSTIASKKSTAAAQTVTAETIENRPNINALQTLQGQVSGLLISSATGQPGAAPNVLLRGFASIGGATEPLYVIDDMPTTATVFRSLNPQDIASMTTLKDAAATAIYGNRGANGVIIVTTRRGTFEKDLEVTYSGFTGISQLQNHRYTQTNSQETLRLERTLGVGLGNTLTDEQINSYGTFNWLNYFFRDSFTQNHNITLSSGGKGINHRTSIGFNDTQGILKNSTLKRFNVNNNTDFRSKNEKFTLNNSLSINFSRNQDPGSIGTGGVNQNMLLGALQSVPYITPDDYISGAALAAQTPLQFRNTPLFLIDRMRNFDNIDDEVRAIAGFNAKYKLTEALTLGSVTSMDARIINALQYQAPGAFNSILFAPGGAANTTPGFMTFSNRREFMFNQVLSLTFNKEFGKHDFNVGVYSEYFKAHLRQFGVRENGLNPATWYPGDGSGFIPDNAQNDWFADVANALYRNAGLFSYFSNLDYAYDGKYGIGGTIRRDASYRFAGSNRWGTFWSVSARWNISEENFMKNSSINLLKLRASYGITGNQNITNSTYWGGSQLFSTLWGTGGAYQGAVGNLFNRIGNDALEWENQIQTNIGLDFGFWKNRVRGSLDVYNRKSPNIFISGPVSLSTGVSSLSQNLGEIDNRGVDLNFSVDIIQAKKQGDFEMSFNFAGNYNKNTINKFDGVQEEIIGTGRVGGPIYELFLIPYVGVNPDNGNLLFLDINGNQTENPDPSRDRRWTGKNFLPDYQGSFGLNFDYKGFFLTTQFNYILGFDRIDTDLLILHNTASIGDFRLHSDAVNHWTPTNTNTNFPRLNAPNANNFNGNSDRFLRSSDFLRLRFASFGYGFNKKQLKGTGLNNLKLFVNAENFLTFTKWDGFDAEQLFIPGVNTDANTGTGRRYPTPRSFTFGLEIGF